MIKRVLLSIVLFLLMAPSMLLAQNHLQKQMIFKGPPTTLGALLDSLEAQGNFYFSYNPSQINPNKKLSKTFLEGSVQSMLYAAIGPEVKMRVVGSHIVLQVVGAKQKSEFLLNGIITTPDGQQIENVIVYDVNERRSIVSKGDGKYKMRIKSKQSEALISYSRPGYHDTLIVVKELSDQQIDIVLRPLPSPKVTASKRKIDSLHLPSTLNRKDLETLNVKEVGLVNVLVPKEALFISQHLNVYERRTFQASFLPFVGSNFISAGVIRNVISFNILAGYSAGTDGIEVGGLANIDKGLMNGVQVGGIANIVGGNVNGLQVGGLMNLNLRKTKGIQLGGLVNINKGTSYGLQVGGLSNFMANDAAGMQLAGLVNSNLSTFSGFQLAGLFNLSNLKKTTPIGEPKFAGQAQLAGIGNYSKNTKGLQVAGISNVNKDTLFGVQVAGIYNHTKVLKGLQVGLINYADTVEKGLSIGLLNIIRTGYHSFQMSSNEVFPANLSIKAGGKHVYTFAKISAGTFMGAGIGIGATTNADRRVSMYGEFVSQMLLAGNTENDVLMGELNNLTAGVQLRVYKRIGISAGPTFNFVQPIKDPTYSLVESSLSGAFYGEKAVIDVLNGQDKTWFGWHASLNFQF